MNYHNDDEQPGTSAGTDNRREELFECFRPVKVFSDRTVRELKRIEPCHQCLVCGYVAACKSNLVIHSRFHTAILEIDHFLVNYVIRSSVINVALQRIYWVIRTSDNSGVLNVITGLLQNRTL